MNKRLKSHAEVTSADDTSVGFEYQYYYFLLLLLNLKEGQSIGLEVKDDVHLETSDGRLVLIQLKHSINPNEENITEKGHDLWKTLSNWARVVCDKNEGRDKKSLQLQYCSKTEFILVSNKGLTNRNKFYKNLKELQEEKITYSDFKTYIVRLHTETLDADLKQQMEYIIKLDDAVAEAFFSKVKIVFGFDDLIERIKSQLRSLHIKEGRIDDLLSTLDGTLRRENYINIKNRKKNQITFQEFSKRYTVYFEVARSSKLIVNRTKLEVIDPLNQIFIKQLIEIEDIEVSDLETIIDYSRHKLLAFNNLARWLQDGDITELDLESLDKNSMVKWKNIHKKTHRTAKAILRKNANRVDKAMEEFISLAQECLDEIRGESLSLSGQELDVDICNGQFYLLSDEPRIGWLYDWQKRYSSNDK